MDTEAKAAGARFPNNPQTIRPAPITPRVWRKLVDPLRGPPTAASAPFSEYLNFGVDRAFYAASRAFCAALGNIHIIKETRASPPPISQLREKVSAASVCRPSPELQTTPRNFTAQSSRRSGARGAGRGGRGPVISSPHAIRMVRSARTPRRRVANGNVRRPPGSDTKLQSDHVASGAVQWQASSATPAASPVQRFRSVCSSSLDLFRIF